MLHQTSEAKDTEQMAEETAPVAPPPAPVAPVAEAPVMRPRDKGRDANLVGALKERLAKARMPEADDDAPPPAVKPATAPVAKAEVTAAKIEAAGGDVPEQKPGESDGRFEARLAKALRELQDAKQEAVRARKEATTSAGEAKKLKELLDRGKLNPLEILEHLGMSFDDVAQGIVSDKYKKPEKKAELPPEIMEEIRLAREERREREAERQRQGAEAQRTKDMGTVSSFIEAHADDFPFAASVDFSARSVLDQVPAGETDVLPYLQEFEEALARDALKLFSGDRAVKALLKKNPAIKKQLLAALGIAGDEPAVREQSDEPRSVSGLTTEATPRTGKRTRADIVEELAAELRARKAAQVEDDD